MLGQYNSHLMKIRLIKIMHFLILKCFVSKWVTVPEAEWKVVVGGDEKDYELVTSIVLFTPEIIPQR